MIAPNGQLDSERVNALQRDPGFLATAYPPPSALASLAPLFESNAWPIQGSKVLSESLMYALVREESRFYPKAISSVGALGLFQIMPRNLHDARRLHKWALLDGPRPDREYLLGAERNVAFWSNWMQTEHNLSKSNDIVRVLMNHQAGSGNVDRWVEFWRTLGVAGDIEYEIETADFPATRSFLRWTLRNLSIVDASGMFEH